MNLWRLSPGTSSWHLFYETTLKNYCPHVLNRNSNPKAADIPALLEKEKTGKADSEVTSIPHPRSKVAGSYSPFTRAVCMMSRAVGLCDCMAYWHIAAAILTLGFLSDRTASRAGRRTSGKSGIIGSAIKEGTSPLHPYQGPPCCIYGLLNHSSVDLCDGQNFMSKGFRCWCTSFQSLIIWSLVLKSKLHPASYSNLHHSS